MTHLGTIGNPRSIDPVTFDYFGAEITANPSLTDLHYLDFMEKVSGLAPSDPASLRFVKDFARTCLADGEFERFWTLALENKQSQEDVFAALMEVLEASTTRPTELPSDSSAGQQETETRSAGVSSSLAERLEGRPDLQLVVKQAAEARAS